MNGDDNGYEGNLKALENLFEGKAESEMSRAKLTAEMQAFFMTISFGVITM